MSTTLLPTPPVAPVTRIIPDVSIFFDGSVDAELDSFSIRDSMNYTNVNQSFVWIYTSTTDKRNKSNASLHATKKGQTLAGLGGPLKKYKVLKNLPKSQACRLDSANMTPLCFLVYLRGKFCLGSNRSNLLVCGRNCLAQRGSTSTF